MTPPEGELLTLATQFDSVFGNRTAVRKQDLKLLR
jgi:hypothetical protein